jgi:hypothetical protein
VFLVDIQPLTLNKRETEVRNLTASDRSVLIRLASSLPSRSPQRKAILAGLGRTSSNPAQVAFNLVNGIHKDNFGKSIKSLSDVLDPRTEKALVDAVAKAIKEGMPTDDDFIDQFSSGEVDQVMIEYKHIRSLKAVDRILNAIFEDL